MSYRDGEVGALLDIYEEDIEKMINLIRDNFSEIARSDREEWDLGRIMDHVVRAGYNYTRYIRENWGGKPGVYPEEIVLDNLSDVELHLHGIFSAMETVLEDKYEFDPSYLENPMTSPWGQVYDLEQIVEHALVHVQRHSRQIKKIYSIQ